MKISITSSSFTAKGVCDRKICAGGWGHEAWDPCGAEGTAVHRNFFSRLFWQWNLGRVVWCKVQHSASVSGCNSSTPQGYIYTCLSMFVAIIFELKKRKKTNIFLQFYILCNAITCRSREHILILSCIIGILHFFPIYIQKVATKFIMIALTCSNLTSKVHI